MDRPNAPTPVSLESSLNARLNAEIMLAEIKIAEAKLELARVALIYSGQLHIDFDNEN